MKKEMFLILSILLATAFCAPAPLPPVSPPANTGPSYKLTTNLPAGETTYHVNTEISAETGLTEIGFLTKTPAEKITVIATPATIAHFIPPEYIAYSYVNVVITDFLDGTLYLHFDVPVSWADEHGGPEQIRVARLNKEEEWDILKTTYTGKTGANYEFMAETKDFSTFAIVSIEEIGSSTPAEEPETSDNSFIWWSVVVVLVVIAGTIFFLLKRKV